MRKVRRFLTMPYEKKWALIEAVLFLYAAKILLFFLPVRAVMKISLEQQKTTPVPLNDSLELIYQAVYQADRLAIWKNRCLVSSIAGRWMLQRRGIPSRISFGVKRDENKKLIAHTWLKSGDFEVVRKDGDYEELVVI